MRDLFTKMALSGVRARRKWTLHRRCHTKVRLHTDNGQYDVLACFLESSVDGRDSISQTIACTGSPLGTKAFYTAWHKRCVTVKTICNAMCSRRTPSEVPLAPCPTGTLSYSTLQCSTNADQSQISRYSKCVFITW